MVSHRGRVSTRGLPARQRYLFERDVVLFGPALEEGRARRVGLPNGDAVELVGLLAHLAGNLVEHEERNVFR